MVAWHRPSVCIFSLFDWVVVRLKKASCCPVAKSSARVNCSIRPPLPSIRIRDSSNAAATFRKEHAHANNAEHRTRSPGVKVTSPRARARAIQLNVSAHGALQQKVSFAMQHVSQHCSLTHSATCDELFAHNWRTLEPTAGVRACVRKVVRCFGRPGAWGLIWPHHHRRVAVSAARATSA